jgi:hypothetical protein
MEKKRITVLMSEEELREVRRRAGLVPLSRYMKEAALKGVGSKLEAGPSEAEIEELERNNPAPRNPMEHPQIVGVNLSALVRSGLVSASATPPGMDGILEIPVKKSAIEPITASSASTAPILEQIKKRKQCVHGKSKGYNCWQCGGLAKVDG